jgi:hypothetical protein
MMSGLKRFRVLAEKGKLPLVVAETKLPHLTAVCVISATGTAFKPFVILPHLKCTKKLSESATDAHFATSQTGWMNRSLFTAWVIRFCAELSLHCLTLPDEIRNESVLLILDGHASRLNLKALTILDACDVDVLCLPSHCTHVIQPFDVAIASPLKTYFKNELKQRLYVIMEADPGKREKTDLLRFEMCTAFLEAYRHATPRANCMSRFRESGIVPFAPEVLLAWQYVMDTRPGEAYQQRSINSKLLTGEEGLDVVGLLQFGRHVSAEDRANIHLEDVCSRLRNATVEDGRQISLFPAIFREVAPGTWLETRQ